MLINDGQDDKSTLLQSLNC